MNQQDRRRVNAKHGSPSPTRTRAFSFGGPKWNVFAERRHLKEPIIEALAAELTNHTGEGAWFAGHIWDGDERHSDKWRLSNAIVLELEYCTRDGIHRALPNGVARTMALLAKQGSWWANLLYATPRGALAIYVLDKPVVLPQGYFTALTGVMELARVELARHALLASRDPNGRPTSGFRLNPQVSKLDQVFFTPRATVERVTRNAEVIIACRKPTSLLRLQNCASASAARRLY